MKILFFTILFSSVFYSAYGCTLKPNPLTDFDQSEYIFIGEIIGYTDTLEFKRTIKFPEDLDSYYKLQLKQASGLKVKVKASVNLPKTPENYFEIFPFDLDGACETLGIQQWRLEKRFPKNSEILVIAKEATIFPHILLDGNFRLEEKKGVNNFIALNSDENDQKLTSAETIFDYKTDINRNYFATRFEIRKDLLRLKNSKVQKDREEIANRILYSYKSYRFVDLYNVFKKYISSTVKAEEFYRRHLQFSDFSKKIVQEEIEKRHKLEQNTPLKRKN